MSFVKGQQQNYYKSARKAAPKKVNVSDITGVCRSCGYLELSPTTPFEASNGGLMVARKDVKILNEKGFEIVKLKYTKSRAINQYWGCNHCVNKW